MFVCCSSAQEQVLPQEITPEAVAQAEVSAPETEEAVAQAKELAQVVEEAPAIEKEAVSVVETEVVERAVSFPLNGQKLGLSIDNTKQAEKGAKILKVKPEGAVAEYNKTAATPVVDGQIIMEAFGVRGNAEEILKAIRENKTDQMALKVFSPLP